MLFGIAAILQAVGSRKVPTGSELDPRRLVSFVVALLKQPAFLGALVLNLAGFGLHFVALRLLPLYLAQAGIAASLVVTALLATRLMSDQLSAIEWSAVVGVCVGLGLLAVSAGEAGETAPHHGLTVGVIVALIAIAVLVDSRAARSTPALRRSSVCSPASGTPGSRSPLACSTTVRSARCSRARRPTRFRSAERSRSCSTRSPCNAVR